MRPRVWIKRCPRCRGDLYEAVDTHGRYIECFQCSHTLSTAEERALRGKGVARPAASRAAPVRLPQSVRLEELIARAEDGAAIGCC